MLHRVTKSRSLPAVRRIGVKGQGISLGGMEFGGLKIRLLTSVIAQVEFPLV